MSEIQPPAHKSHASRLPEHRLIPRRNRRCRRVSALGSHPPLLETDAKRVSLRADRPSHRLVAGVSSRRDGMAQVVHGVTAGLQQHAGIFRRADSQCAVGNELDNYHEPFDSVRFQACLFIWCGLIIYTADSFWTQRIRTMVRPVTSPLR
jgi:hypothetical protein